MAIQFSEEQIIDKARFENPWWESHSIDTYFNGMKRREYFSLFFPLVKERSVKRALVLMGPRRVGKTVLLYHSIDALIQSGIDPRHICYFSIETPLYNGCSLEELVKIFLKVNSLKKADQLYIIFDEIQYLKSWEIHLKSLVDSYHNYKFIVSGSAAAALKLRSQESGAGRFTEFILPPLTFHEYLELSNLENLISNREEVEDWFKPVDIKTLNQKFLDYINFGGYPELSLSPIMQSDPGRYVRSDIIDKVLLRDLPSLYGINDIQELNSLFTYIAYNTGSEMSLDGISQNAGVAKNTIKKYLTYLEAAFLIKIIHRVDQNSKKFNRANFFKVYLTNPALRGALFSPVSGTDSFLGNMVETAIFSQWQHSQLEPLYYARWATGEVDLVSLDVTQKPNWCIEIKYSNRYVNNFSELKNMRIFCNKHNILSAVVTTIDIFKIVKVDNTTYEFVPASVYAYTVGRNLIKGRLEMDVSNKS